jgi:hypothetical protein
MCRVMHLKLKGPLVLLLTVLWSCLEGGRRFLPAAVDSRLNRLQQLVFVCSCRLLFAAAEGPVPHMGVFVACEHTWRVSGQPLTGGCGMVSLQQSFSYSNQLYSIPLDAAVGTRKGVGGG